MRTMDVQWALRGSPWVLHGPTMDRPWSHQGGIIGLPWRHPWTYHGGPMDGPTSHQGCAVEAPWKIHGASMVGP